jgi:segregation and condensation protein B
MPDRPMPAPDAVKLRAILEALIFAAEEPLTLEDLNELFPRAGEGVLREALEELTRSCQAEERGLHVSHVAGGYRLTTKGELGEWVRALFRSRNRRRLSGAALETLAIVAYRQPVTTPEIQSIRGSDPVGVLQSLLEKKLVRVLGRKKVVGKPILYGTTREFLAHFGLNSLADLPSMEEFGGLASSVSAGVLPLKSEPAFEEDNGRDDGGNEDYEDEDEEDENEHQDDGDDS